MRHLKIQNVGPLKLVDIELQKLNVIVGEQSSGKSCVLKIACYCDWVEKQLAVRLAEDKFKQPKYFLNELTTFHKLEGFIRTDSVIEYETDSVWFKYEAATDTFTNGIKGKFFGYRNRKICYIPAERILLAAIPNWYSVQFDDNNIRSFLTDWHDARVVVDKMDVLNLGVQYAYVSDSNLDRIILDSNNLTFNFTNASSGLQSVIPLVVVCQYLCNELHTIELKSSILQIIQERERANRLQQWIESLPEQSYERKLAEATSDLQQTWLDRMSHLYHSDIYLEEPEMNLFPNTQAELIAWMVEQINSNDNHSLFVATHSPYILTALNNLIQAGNVLEEDYAKLDAIKDIVVEGRIINYNHIGAFAIEDGVVKSIKDDEYHLISANKIDEASGVIAQQFEQLLSL